MKFANNYYVKEGKVTREPGEIKLALRPLLRLYGSEKARTFGPLALKAVRQHMVDSDLSRGVINNRVNKIRRFFKWAVSEELVPPSVSEGLRTVTGLLYGRTAARESDAHLCRLPWLPGPGATTWPPGLEKGLVRSPSRWPPCGPTAA